MIIAMCAVRMVEVAVHQIVHMVAVRHNFVATTWPMYVRRFMTITGVARGACTRVRRRNRNHMLIHVIAMRVMQVTIMKVVHMVVVANGQMSAACAVLVVVMREVCLIAGGHGMLRKVNDGTEVAANSRMALE